MNLKKVSVIITTKNRKDLLKRAIESVKKQTYKNIELIVINDGSTDGTNEMLEKMKVKTIYIEPNKSKGGNYARNLGVINTDGEYIAFLDDDDEWMPTKIEKQVDILKKYTSVGVVGCARLFEVNHSRVFKSKFIDLIEGDVSNLIFTGIPYTTSALLIRRTDFIRCGMFDENMKAWQEYELEIRLSQITKFKAVHEYLLLYRVIDKDKNRITNNLDGWEVSVKYMIEKHKAIIDTLPMNIKNKFYSLVFKDGAKRADRIGNNSLKRKYLKKAFEYERNFKNFVKFVLNKSKRGNLYGKKIK